MSWREVLDETRFKSKLFRRFSIAGGIWVFVMAVLFGVPVVFGFLTDHQKSLCREHSRQFNEVSTIKEKVEIIKKYSNHDRGAHEIMKAISDRLPQGIDLDSWSFKRDDGLKISGVGDEDVLVYKFKDALEAITIGEDGEKLFKKIDMGNLSASRGRQKFTIELGYAAEEEE